MSRNPYILTNTEPSLQNSVLVFMDILGYSELMDRAQTNGTAEAALRNLHRALTSSRRGLEDIDISEDFRQLSSKDLFALKAFTDNIVIGWPIYDDAEVEFGAAVIKLASFQFEMTLSGYFVRGAISAGPAYIDEIAVFGSALTEAYAGETKLARDPRIILSKSMVKIVKKHLKYYHPPQDAPHVRELLRDSDGQWFVNYLESVLIAAGEQGPFLNEFLQHKAVVEDRLQEHYANPVIWSKYAWVAGYHNYFCELHPSYFDDSHKIRPDLLRSNPTLII